jgi:hypothetical protein
VQNSLRKHTAPNIKRNSLFHFFTILNKTYTKNTIVTTPSKTAPPLPPPPSPDNDETTAAMRRGTRGKATEVVTTAWVQVKEQEHRFPSDNNHSNSLVSIEQASTSMKPGGCRHVGFPSRHGLCHRKRGNSMSVLIIVSFSSNSYCNISIEDGYSYSHHGIIFRRIKSEAHERGDEGMVPGSSFPPRIWQLPTAGIQNGDVFRHTGRRGKEESGVSQAH